MLCHFSFPIALALLAAAGVAKAQGAAPGEVSTSFAFSVTSQLTTDLDKGGDFQWRGYGLKAGVSQQFTQAFSAGVSAQYGTERWEFSGMNAFGSAAPWRDIERPSLGLNLGYRLGGGRSVFVAPQVEWAYESGASAADGLSYGAVFGATQFYSPTLFVGLGLGVFRQIDKTKYFPFVIVNWQITDALRLSNPLPSGPAGGAGLELAYAWPAGWELAGGAAYRDYRFRLKSNGPVAAGLGQNSGVPVFARLTRKFGPAAQLDLYAGYVLNGRLKVMNASGATVQQSDYGASPMLALTGSVSF